MTYRIPYLRVLGPDGDQLASWGKRLIGVQLIDRAGFESDEAVFRFAVKPPFMQIPAEGTPYTVSLGWSADALAVTGIYTFQRAHFFGEPGSGRQMHLVCRAGDFLDKIKEADGQHFDKGNGNATLGDVFRNLFKGTGKTVQVAPAIDGKPLPGGYLLQHNQTPADAATDLAQNNRAVWKVAGDTIIVLPLDAGVSVSGSALGRIAIDRANCVEYDCEVEPRFRYSSVAVPWFDPGAGKSKLANSPTLQGGGDVGGLPHFASGQDDAQAQADSYAAEFGREEFTGMFVVPGDPTATAGAFVATTGFPPDIQDAKLQCETLTDEWTPERAWTSTVEVKQVPS